MFGFFKKKEAPREKVTPENWALKQFAAEFYPEELDILAVTGPSGFGAVRLEETGLCRDFGAAKPVESGLWQASIGLTAWMDADSLELHQGETGLVTICDDTLRGYLRQRTPADFIIKFRARLSLDGTRLLLLDLPQPGFDPDLKAILEQQKKPEHMDVDGLGTFTLNRQVGWFETELDWLGQQIRLDFDKGPEENMQAAQDTGRMLLADAAGWDARVRTFAAEQLTGLANEWAADGEAEEPAQEITPEDFAHRLELDAIQVEQGGSFTFWFNDGEMFWGHSVRVSGTLERGPADAQMEG